MIGFTELKYIYISNILLLLNKKNIKMLKFLDIILTYFDYFGLPIQLILNKKKKFKTFIGGMLSVVIYCLIFP
jgi:hypothetical protein